MSWFARAAYKAARHLRRRGLVVEKMTQDERTYLTSPFAPDSIIPADAGTLLSPSAEGLHDLRRRYAALKWPVTTRSRWADENLKSHMDLRHFRGETPFMWHYRERMRITRLKFLAYLQAVQAVDQHRLLEQLVEDGAFGCWTYQFQDQPLISRDLLESVVELNFLERTIGLLSGQVKQVLDIGAGYGRLAHRTLNASAQVEHYCCIDAIAESTYLCDYYLKFRQATSRAQVLALDEVEQLRGRNFDLAVNIHSFSECPFEAIAWWMDQIGELRIPWLLIVPNQPRELLSTEPDNSKRDFSSLIEGHGYTLQCIEPTISDAAVRYELSIHDHFHLYRLT